jgi:hypothetical protein
MVRHDRPAISAADRDVNRTMSRLLRNSLARSARRFDCERRFRDFAIADWARAIDERTASTCARAAIRWWALMVTDGSRAGPLPFSAELLPSWSCLMAVFN